MDLVKSLNRMFKSSFLTSLVFLALIVFVAYMALDHYGYIKTKKEEKMTVCEQQEATLPTTVQSNSQYNSQVANPADLLPSDANSDINRVLGGNQNGVAVPDVLEAGYHIGLDTVGQTLRNANQQLRSDPYIQKKDVCGWNQSTIEPDIARVPLELGAV